ncbi:MAG: DUF4387 family protein [Clostridia bacterium]|nr:DUF4387 family protein [Clostridia bacterium]
MKQLIEYTRILRSKNAGPLFITFDLIFPDVESMRYVKERITAQMVAEAYGVNAEKVDIISYEVVNSIKITFPRKSISGALSDDDVYGCQQHLPLAQIVL